MSAPDHPTFRSPDPAIDRAPDASDASDASDAPGELLVRADDHGADDPRSLDARREPLARADDHGADDPRSLDARGEPLARTGDPRSPDVPGEPLLPPDDHRALGTQLDLWHFQDDAPGMVFWHPRGWAMFRVLEDAARAHVLAGGYREVRTPQLVRRAIWERSGHWDAFAGSMFASGDGASASALKPVSCPCHIQIVRRASPSWRDLPLRLAEFGLVHRDEASGTLHGLMRLRQFTQDDGHIFCAADQVAGEVARFCRELPAFYRRFGFADVSVALSLRPDHRLGDDAWWDRAERELADIVAGLGLPCEVQPGAGAIYGPKLEFVLRDRRGRPWQLGTIQLDLVMPHRFDVQYVDAAGGRRHVVMLHRALFGSLERFLGILLEHHGLALPPWLAPEQVVLAAVDATVAAQREAVAAASLAVLAAGLRCRIADGGPAAAVAAAHRDRIPFVAILGDREVRDGTLAVRDLDGQRWSAPRAPALAALVDACRVPA